MKKIAIIGAGNMGSAIAASLIGQEYQIVCTAASRQTLDTIKSEMPDISTSSDNVEAVTDADIIILSVKPYVAFEVLSSIRDHLKSNAIILSVVASLNIDEIQNVLNAPEKKLQIIRAVPNTAIRYKSSVTFLSPANDTSEEATALAVKIFSLSGKTFIVGEDKLAACISLASCGIAYFLRFIRAAVEGGVELGLKADFATEITALTAAGAAALLQSGSHPEAEIDKVTTPGGMTIKGLNALEAHGFTAAVIAAVKAPIIDD